jgi:hypothetical protein
MEIYRSDSIIDQQLRTNRVVFCSTEFIHNIHGIHAKLFNLTNVINVTQIGCLTMIENNCNAIFYDVTMLK